MRRLTLLIALMWLMLAAALAGAAPQLDQVKLPADMPQDSGCRSCHQDITAPMPPGDHAKLSCAWCHQGQGLAEEKDEGHQGLVANPSALDQAGRACGTCHQGWPEKVARSPMATNMGLINQTRYLWGAQPDALPRYGVSSAPKLLPIPTPEESGQAVDGFLRGRCLRCHLGAPGADLAGARRSAGCAACHRPHDQEGQPPRGHGLTKRIPVSQCLTCHAGCGAGAAYTGRIPRDARRGARFLAADPEDAPLWQARRWRPMQPDAHFSAGMACIDCHPRPEIMGDGQLRPAGLMHVGLRCATCHGTPGKEPMQAVTSRGVRLDQVARLGGGLVLIGKLDGKGHRAPSLAGGGKAPVAHQVPEHGRMACHACHNQTNPAAWGLMVQRETRDVYQVWRDIAAQGDPQVLELLSRPLPKPPLRAMPPMTRDYLSGERRPGLWVVSPFFRRFEWRVYVQAPDGRTMLLNPRFQYVVTLLDQEGRLEQEARVPSPGLGVTPWHAHTVGRAAPGCADCHGRARVLGLGMTFVKQAKDQPRPQDQAKSVPPEGQAGELAPLLWDAGKEGLPQGLDWTRVCDQTGKPVQAFLVPGSRPFDAQELGRLLAPGKDYHRWLLKALDEEWPQAQEPGDKQASAGGGER